MTSQTVFCLSVQLRPNHGTDVDGTPPGTTGVASGVASATPNNGHIIFLRGIKSDNGKLVLTRDESARLPERVLAVGRAGNRPVLLPADDEQPLDVGTEDVGSVPLGNNGEPIKLPENLESLPKAEHFPTQRHRWNTNEEIAAILISFDRHSEWQSKEVRIRPKSGSMLLYSRKKVRYRRDGYCWKKRKDGKTTREDHMKLKVQGTECIYGCYVHSAILPTFHRRCYWLLQNPDIVLVHYLNVPYPDDNKLACVAPSLALWADKKEWTKDELVSQLKPMFFSEDEPDINNELEISTAETVETIVTQLMEKQRAARQAALVKQLECGSPDSTCAQDGKQCPHHPMLRRIRGAATMPVNATATNEPVKSTAKEDVNHVSSTTGTNCTMLLSSSVPRLYGNASRLHPNPHPKRRPPITESASATPPLVLSLSQLQTGASGGLLILNNSAAAQHQQPTDQQPFGRLAQKDKQRPTTTATAKHREATLVVKQEAMETNCLQANRADAVNGNCVTLYTPVGATPAKRMDTNNDGGTDIQLSFDDFNETLDLSHEDIQRTLSANMPNGVRKIIDMGPSGGHPCHTAMDYFDASITSPIHGGGAATGLDDDVFVNLDAFDMLGEFPDFEVLDGGTLLESADKGILAPPHAEPGRDAMVDITDYSPEWAYPEGGVKVLVTGPWYSTTSPYTVLFDTFPVPTTLVQSGVLRCYCPAHEAGLATLQVACDGYVITNSVIFEYKLPPPEDADADANVARMRTTTHQQHTSDNLFKFTLLHRLESMDEKLLIKQEPEGNDAGIEDSTLLSHPSFEDRLVAYWQRRRNARHWRQQPDEDADCALSACNHRGMTLLHLAAALGYAKLISVMLQWRTENTSLLLETEVDALRLDDDGYTPLMWACARGHTNTAQILYRWNPTALNLKNAASQTALECARANQHGQLVAAIEQLMARPTNRSHVRDDVVFVRPGTGGVGHKLIKRPSVDSGIHLAGGSSVESLTALPKSRGGVRDIPKLSRFDRSMSLPLNSPLSTSSTSSTNDHSFDNGSDVMRTSPIRRIECTLSETQRSNSPLIDVEGLSDDDSDDAHAHTVHGAGDERVGSNADKIDERQTSVVGEQEVRVLTLAEQIIAAIPDHIKNESEEMQLDSSPKQMDSYSNNGGDNLSDVFLMDQSSSSFDNAEFNFEFSDHNYRYYDVGTPCSSLSPASSACLQSPGSFTLDSPSPPPTTADFCEFFQAAGAISESDFSSLTLSEREQRELYEAAKTIQKAFRSYRGRQHRAQGRQPPDTKAKEPPVDKERAAAVLIQNYYRRYKQYAYFKQMTKAAMVIQSGYRLYCEHKRFKKSQEAAVCIQNYYRNYREQGGSRRGSRESTPSTATGLKRTYSQRRQHQAARKIQQFMRQSKNKLQRERAEKERQAAQLPVVARPRSPFLGPSYTQAPHQQPAPPMLPPGQP